jgi:hypothetical protein
MRRDGSPYRKARASVAPLRIKTLPRRSRALVVAAICLLILWLLPVSRVQLGRTALFVLFSPQVADSFGLGSSSWSSSSAASKFKVLQYVDPLIGTANGGHVFPGATLPYGMFSVRTHAVRCD